MLLILFSNLHVVFRYDEKAKVTLRILFISIDGMKLFQHLTKENKNKSADVRSVDSAPSNEESTKKKGSVLGFLDFLLRITDVISYAVSEHLKRMKVRLKMLHVSVGTSDAAHTALLYGAAVQ